MSTQPFTSGKFRALDSNGAPLAGGLLYTYAAGTTTPQATYTDYTGATPNANPVVLDASGSADVWLTPGVLYKFVLQNSLGAVQYTEDNFPAPPSTTTNTSAVTTEPGGRLSLTSGIPVTTSDVTAATTIYYVCYKSDRVPLFDGTNWSTWSIGAQLQQATADNTKSPAAVVANSNYDCFIWNDAGTIRLSRGPAWTSDTSRGTGVGTTEITTINGRYVNKNSITNGPGATLGLYVGTVRSDGSAQINDSKAKRHVFNAYHRVRRMMSVLLSGATWLYGSATIRQANATLTNQLDMVLGLSEDAVVARVRVPAEDSAGAGGSAFVGIGLDSTTAISADCASIQATLGTAVAYVPLVADYSGVPGLGHHTLVWLEAGLSTESIRYGGTSSTSGIQGDMMG